MTPNTPIQDNMTPNTPIQDNLSEETYNTQNDNALSFLDPNSRGRWPNPTQRNPFPSQFFPPSPTRNPPYPNTSFQENNIVQHEKNFYQINITVNGENLEGVEYKNTAFKILEFMKKNNLTPTTFGSSTKINFLEKRVKTSIDPENGYEDFDHKIRDAEFRKITDLFNLNANQKPQEPLVKNSDTRNPFDRDPLEADRAFRRREAFRRRQRIAEEVEFPEHVIAMGNRSQKRFACVPFAVRMAAQFLINDGRVSTYDVNQALLTGEERYQEVIRRKEAEITANSDEDSSEEARPLQSFLTVAEALGDPPSNPASDNANEPQLLLDPNYVVTELDLSSNQEAMTNANLYLEQEREYSKEDSITKIERFIETQLKSFANNHNYPNYKTTGVLIVNTYGCALMIETNEDQDITRLVFGDSHGILCQKAYVAEFRGENSANELATFLVERLGNEIPPPDAERRQNEAIPWITFTPLKIKIDHGVGSRPDIDDDDFSDFSDFPDLSETPDFDS